MNNEGLRLTAKAHVKLTKLDESGNIIGVEEREVNLSEEEVKNLWRSQQQE